ncbi:unnamed protein product [Phytophthora fragariaefolia]|uniref:Unnamed protein product n=1 Tax=Phytophthora fragariaefolia TaxID=1490495 RepID=A0A9W7D4J3_9STRA|nr:unnamed protein product [Phytophthora fragariaefolia]
MKCKERVKGVSTFGIQRSHAEESDMCPREASAVKMPVVQLAGACSLVPQSPMQEKKRNQSQQHKSRLSLYFAPPVMSPSKNLEIMDSMIKKVDVDVERNTDGRPVNWNGQDWPLEQLAALDVDVSDVWMDDLMVRSMSQCSRLLQPVQTLMLLYGTQTLSTPEGVKAMTLILEKHSGVKRQLRIRQVAETTGHYNPPHNGGRCGDGHDISGGSGVGRGAVGGSGKSLPGYQSRNQNNNNNKNGADGGNRGGYTKYKRRPEEEQKQ